MLLVELIVVAALIIVNGFLAMSELALVSAKKPILERMQRNGSRGAAVALALTQEPGRMLSTVQVGITLVGIMAGAFVSNTEHFIVRPSPNAATRGWRAWTCRPESLSLWHMSW